MFKSCRLIHNVYTPKRQQQFIDPSMREARLAAVLRFLLGEERAKRVMDDAGTMGQCVAGKRGCVRWGSGVGRIEMERRSDDLFRHLSTIPHLCKQSLACTRSRATACSAPPR